MYAMISAVAVAILSIMGNVVQFLINKKVSDIDRLEKQVDLLGKIQEKQTQSYESERKMQDEKISILNSKIEDQERLLNKNKQEILKLQGIVTKLLANGCHKMKDCKDSSPYTQDEIRQFIEKP